MRLVLLIVPLLIGTSIPLEAASSPYYMDKQAVGRYKMDRHGGGLKKVNIRFYHRRGGRLLWKWLFYDPHLIKWSSDGRAVAIVDYDPKQLYSHLRLTTWQEGEGFHHFIRLKSLQAESVVDMVWSPDRKRLAMISAMSMGDGMVGTGQIWCIHPQRKLSHYLANRGSSEPRWKDNRRISFKTYGFDQKRSVYRVLDNEHQVTCPFPR